MDTPAPNQIKQGLPPAARPDARLFILGSLPGDASLVAKRYYAHPRNNFWRLVGDAIGEELAGLDYDERLRRLGERRIGLWDVIASAKRRGSLDQAIRSAGHNPLAHYFAGFAELQAVALNGAAAAAAGLRLLDGSGLTLIPLPSSSPANTMPYAAKVKAWRVLSTYL
ncbi:MAG TPA: DNA-deoxyinosine glycosylase [Sphingomicrobium sp.]|nr:DNA-deoxyinosine glycosylase [Sphingomicrobium sp.]